MNDEDRKELKNLLSTIGMVRKPNDLSWDVVQKKANKFLKIMEEEGL
jgi:hypothetical protein